MVDKRIPQSRIFPLLCRPCRKERRTALIKFMPLGEAAKLSMAAKESHLRKKLNLTQ